MALEIPKPKSSDPKTWGTREIPGISNESAANIPDTKTIPGRKPTLEQHAEAEVTGRSTEEHLPEDDQEIEY